MTPLHVIRTAYRLALWGVPILAAGGLVGCGGDNSSGPPVMVSVSADPTSLQPGATAQVTATVSNDADNRGVNWTVSCAAAPCGVVSPASTGSAIATTYTAPAEPPSAGLAVSITATSVRNKAVSASAQVTVAGGMAISIAPGDNTTVPGGTSTQFTATVVNDAARAGVTWMVVCSAAPCGTVSPTTTASGVATTYTAPPTIVSPDPGVASALDVTLTATSVSNKAVSASALLLVPERSVVISIPGPMAAGTTAQLSATVDADPANQGVKWTLQCSAADCGKLSASASASGAQITYTAPATPPLAELAVTITATSVSPPVAKTSGTINIEPISVAVTPVSALIPLGITQPFTGTLGSDLSTDSIAWTIAQNGAVCANACGTFSPSSSASGTAVTYTAPGTMPASSTVTVTAASVAEPTRLATATITLTTGSVKLVPVDLAFIKVRQRVPPTQTATLTNTGNAPLNISRVAIGGANPTAFSQTNSCGSSLTAKASCDITVKFEYANCSNQCTAVLSISDSSSDSPQQLHLTGTRQQALTAAMRTALARQATVLVPVPRGGATVGTHLMHLLDAKRADPYVPGGTARELMLRMWYPASAGGRCVAADYTSPQVWDYFSTLVGVPLPQVSTHSCLDAPIATGRHPVVVLEHGFTGTFTDYTFLAEDLASRGYLVVAVDHTHEATAVEFPDGRLEKSVFGSHLTEYTRSDAGALGLAVAVRLDDLRFTLNELARLDAAPSGDLAGRLDLTQIALIGHSLGGLTTLRALDSEPRFKAGVLLDAVMPPYYAKPIEQPVLSLVAGREQWNEDDCRLWSALHGSRMAANLPGADHIALSDAVWLLDGTIRTGDASSEQTVSGIRSYVASFLDVNLQGKASLPSSVQYPGAIVASGAQSLCRAQ